MTDSISSISFSTAASTSFSSGVKEETKKKLESLGLDPSKYTTEAQAQEALTKAQAAKDASKTQASKPAQGGDSEQAIQTEIEELAAKMGVSIGNKDSIDDIFNNVSAKLTELKAGAGNDPTKKAEAEGYKTTYDSISAEYSQIKAAKNMTGATAMANYTKFSLGLS